MTLSAMWQRLPRFLRILLKRLPMVIPQVLGVIFVTFMLVRLLPGDPALLMLGNMATEESIQNLRDQLGLNDSLLEQFVSYLGGVVRGDLGISLFTSNPVAVDLMERAPATLEMIFYAMLLTVLIGVTVAVLAVVRPGGVADYISRFYGMAAGAIPDFWVGLLLIFFLFSVLGIAPAPFGRIDPMVTPPPTITGFYTFDALMTGNFDAFRSAVERLILPVLTLTIVNAGALMKMSKTAFADIWRADFIRHQRASGLPQGRIIRNALRNSLPPVITLVGFLMGFLLGAAVLVETIFSWGGLGQYAVQAVTYSDYPALQGFVLVAAVFILVVYLVVDILYELTDPRIQT